MYYVLCTQISVTTADYQSNNFSLKSNAKKKFLYEEKLLNQEFFVENYSMVRRSGATYRQIGQFEFYDFRSLKSFCRLEKILFVLEEWKQYLQKKTIMLLIWISFLTFLEWKNHPFANDVFFLIFLEKITVNNLRQYFLPLCIHTRHTSNLQKNPIIKSTRDNNADNFE